jgi:hypothetical protein
MLKLFLSKSKRGEWETSNVKLHGSLSSQANFDLTVENSRYMLEKRPVGES